MILFCTLGFSQEIPHKKMERECEECHATGNWEQVNFDHQKAKFVLESRHALASCTDCHTVKDFTDVSRECKSCHLDVHQGKLLNDCEKCHTPERWNVLDVNKAHAFTTFPVIGAHSRLDCIACHTAEIEGEFFGLLTECYSCHQIDYRSTQNPTHTEIGFSRDCENCHAPLSWIPATFPDHEPRFPISSGAHAGEWQSCTDCHINPNNYSDFSCLNCHEHNQSKMVDTHDEERGFSYDSQACYNCHPRGRAEDD
jgi:hypothetical protein